MEASAGSSARAAETCSIARAVCRKSERLSLWYTSAAMLATSFDDGVSRSASSSASAAPSRYGDSPELAEAGSAPLSQ